MSQSGSSSPAVISGFVAGSTEVVAVQPLDIVKTRFQIYAGKNPSVYRGLCDLVHEGGFPRLYRGLLPEAVSTVPARTAMWCGHDAAARILVDSSIGKHQQEFLSGAFSGVPESLVVTPLQLVKVRLQAREHLGRYRNFADCTMKIAQQEGFTAFFIGLGPTMGRNIVWNSMYFWSASEVKWHFASLGSALPHVLWTAITSFGCGVFATIFNAPFDVAKSRIQQQVSGSEVKYRNTLQTLNKILQEEGPQAVFKGFSPKALRMGLGFAVAQVAFDAMQFCQGA